MGSILNYSAEVIGLYEVKDIEMIHTKFCRWILHVRKSTNLTGLYGELGRVPFIVIRKIRMINYWIKLLSLGKYCTKKNLYDAETRCGSLIMGQTGLFRLNHLLDKLGLTYVWLRQGDITIPFSLTKQRILDLYKQTWYAEINNSNRLLMYSRFKHELDFENYLDFISEKNIRLHSQNSDFLPTT